MDYCILRTPFVFTAPTISCLGAPRSDAEDGGEEKSGENGRSTERERERERASERASERAKEQYRNCRARSRLEGGLQHEFSSASICRYSPRVRYYRTWNALERLSSTCRPSFVIVTVYGVRSLAATSLRNSSSRGSLARILPSSYRSGSPLATLTCHCPF
jgi:hypothetical protein